MSAPRYRRPVGGIRREPGASVLRDVQIDPDIAVLHEPLLKVDRAHELLAEFGDYEAAYFATAPLEVWDEHTESLLNGWCRIVDEPPVRLGLLIGEIANALRSSLDYAVFQITGEPDDRSIEFPVVRARADWPARVARIGQYLPADHALITVLQAHQPFERPRLLRLPIQELHDVARFSRHRVTPLTVLRETARGLSAPHVSADVEHIWNAFATEPRVFVRMPAGRVASLAPDVELHPAVGLAMDSMSLWSAHDLAVRWSRTVQTILRDIGYSWTTGEVPLGVVQRLKYAEQGNPTSEA